MDSIKIWIERRRVVCENCELAGKKYKRSRKGLLKAISDWSRNSEEFE